MLLHETVSIVWSEERARVPFSMWRGGGERARPTWTARARISAARKRGHPESATGAGSLEPPASDGPHFLRSTSFFGNHRIVEVVLPSDSSDFYGSSSTDNGITLCR